MSIMVGISDLFSSLKMWRLWTLLDKLVLSKLLARAGA